MHPNVRSDKLVVISLQWADVESDKYTTGDNSADTSTLNLNVH